MESRREYDNTRRRKHAAETRNRIVTAGAELLQKTPIRDWDGLTVAAVAERAGVSDRTVFRHFGNERELREAVMARLENDAGVDLSTLEIDDLPRFAAQVLEYVSAYPMAPRQQLDPTLSGAHDRRREALLGVVDSATEGWSDEERTVAAAVLDLLCGVPAYERMLADWGLDNSQAIGGITWAIRLVGDAVSAGQAPSTGPTPDS